MIYDFFDTVINLKSVSREGWKKKLGISFPESVADHSYSMSIMAMIFSDLHNLNTEKILKMSLMHDLAESVIGDLTPDEISKERKNELESNAMKKILAFLPQELNESYLKIWTEYLDKKTEESMLLHEIDRLEMAFQAKKYYELGHSPEQIKTFFETAKTEIKSKPLVEILSKLIK